MGKKPEYRLVVKPLGEGEFSCELRIEPNEDSKAPLGRKSKPVSVISGWHLGAAEGYIKRVLKSAGYQARELRRGRKTPFALNEELGVKLDLVFRSLRDLKKRTKIEDVLLGIENMSREEALYWHSKIEQDRKRGEQRGLKALRILLGGE